MPVGLQTEAQSKLRGSERKLGVMYRVLERQRSGFTQDGRGDTVIADVTSTDAPTVEVETNAGKYKGD